MNSTVTHMLTTVMITTTMLMMMNLVSKKSISEMQKSTPFECGFNTNSKKRLPFSIHFFLIAVIFLIFDIEIIIVMPMILTLKSSMTMNWMMTLMTFITMLTMGLYHEWNTGMLNWTK